MKLYCNCKDETSKAKHIAFLLTWLSKLISYNHSQKVTRHYLRAVVALAIGKDVALGPFILNHICKGRNDLTSMNDG